MKYLYSLIIIKYHGDNIFTYISKFENLVNEVNKIAMINICTSTIICKIRCPVIFSDFFKSVANILSHIAIIPHMYIILLLTVFFIYKLFFVKLKNSKCYICFYSSYIALDNVLHRQHSVPKSSEKLQFWNPCMHGLPQRLQSIFKKKNYKWSSPRFIHKKKMNMKRHLPALGSFRTYLGMIFYILEKK